MSVAKKYCVIGHPVAHSLSPEVQNAAFEKLGIEAVFEKVDVQPDELGAFMHRFRSVYDGCNVTIPHKEKVIEYLDELSDDARLIGAVNVVVTENGRLIGHNTDRYGAMTALAEGLCGKMNGKNVIVLGAGGAARALVYGCLRAGANITILNRTLANAKTLADAFNQIRKDENIENFHVIKYGSLDDWNVEQCDLLVNTTPVGMEPGIDSAPIDILHGRSEISRTNFTVMDIIYRPLFTKLLRDAQEIGAKIITGDTMFLHQAARAFELWTGQKAPLEIMRKILTKELFV